MNQDQPSFLTLRRELSETLGQLQETLARVESEDQLDRVLDLLGSLPGLIRPKMRKTGMFDDVCDQLDRARTRLAFVVKRPSYSSIPAPAATPHFQAAVQFARGEKKVLK